MSIALIKDETIPEASLVSAFPCCVDISASQVPTQVTKQSYNLN